MKRLSMITFAIFVALIFSCKVSVVVNEHSVLSSIEIETLPTKTVYLLGDELDTEGLSVRANYNDGSSKIVDGWSVDNFTSEVKNESLLLTVVYQEKDLEKDAFFSVKICPRLTSISLSGELEKTRYEVGDEFSGSGVSVLAEYEDGSSAAVDGWTVDFDSSKGAVLQDLTVTYEENGISRQTGTLPVMILYDFHSVPESFQYNGTLGENGKYIIFGDWPQTIVPKDSDLVLDEEPSIFMGQNAYYVGNDGNYYSKILENGNSNVSYSDGSTPNSVKNNSYRIFKVEPLKWRVLSDSYNDGKLLLCENIVMSGIPYCDRLDVMIDDGKTIYPNNYANSTIRAYLNGSVYRNSSGEDSRYKDKGFFQSAFTVEGRKIIVESLNSNDGESTSDGKQNKADGSCGLDYTCEPTKDYVFLLSQKDVTDSEFGFGDANETVSRLKFTSDYATANYQKQALKSGWWWVRSPGYKNKTDVRGVNSDGTADEKYFHSVNSSYGGIVPSIVIKN